MTINSPAQAGTDAYGMAAGTGTGLGAPGGSGTCFGANCGGGEGGGVSEALYRRYLSNALQVRVQNDDSVNRLTFTADFAITITPDGRVSRVELLRSSGKEDRDEVLRKIIATVGTLDPPPQSIRFPQKITVRGRRSL
jgi:TonB family protein